MKFIEIETQSGRRFVNIDKLIDIQEIQGGCFVHLWGEVSFTTYEAYRELKKRLMMREQESNGTNA